MHMAATLQRSLERAQCQFDVVPHPHSASSLESARVASVPAERLAKPVILDDRKGHYLMAVVPANRHLDMSMVCKGDELWHLSTESDIASLFKDCELGAVPAVGEPYGMNMRVDPLLTRQQDIYFEAGDHESLVHMSTEQFLKLVPRAEVRELCPQT
ncbi:YbaK/EbsC family protein [Pseudomonas lalucatii]|uniref:YbaK/EbsC family protein n=1 Tax=Pseudomonas lalucatii TaxID=1424203 RepID=A0ABS5Q1P8_9PSED|nr:YbaK/EbsC family protein [Pseudomonas lalucatii]MBS7662666.1 YbaK/EbsC family protein [Pseudomonas lalucatii]MBS7691092.1 YbaK/EbsC family protein [Pseudomonas lalucatii]MBS7725773.1 YbaK/EbsC family protein [Pseudomonas lalucatii]QVM88613.1 YbaK/EbsC family protein [Pseudomonas lalucatii]